MKKIVHPAAERGHANHGWLNSYHSFSFSTYYDPEKVHFGTLRVLNDDTVAGGMGFGAHPHDNMEIISIPLEGTLEHRDNTGSKGTIVPGEVQVMSAGTGIVHSEYNSSKTEPVKFLQIWIFPRERNISPRYDQKKFSEADFQGQLKLVVSPDRNEDVLWINQDARLYLGLFEKETNLDYTLPKGHGAYLFIIEGSAEVAGEHLGARDAIGISETDKLSIKAGAGSYLLLMDLPMEV